MIFFSLMAACSPRADNSSSVSSPGINYEEHSVICFAVYAEPSFVGSARFRRGFHDPPVEDMESVDEIHIVLGQIAYTLGFVPFESVIYYGHLNERQSKNCERAGLHQAGFRCDLSVCETTTRRLSIVDS